jgi:tRNA(fMet)-specific endonuclease VapC
VKYLLDTHHLSILQQQSGPEYAALAARLAAHPPADFGLSVVSFHEQVLGCHTYISRARNDPDLVRGYGMLARLLSDYVAAPVLPFDAAAASSLAALLARRVRVATMDLRIASLALSRGLILLTRNTRDFGQVPGLVTEDWTAVSP